MRVHYNLRFNKFNPEEASQDCPVPIRAIKSTRRTIRRSLDGTLFEEEEDQWQKGVTEAESTHGWIGRTMFSGDQSDGPTEDRRVRPRLEEVPTEENNFPNLEPIGRELPDGPIFEEMTDPVIAEPYAGQDDQEQAGSRTRYLSTDEENEDRPAKRIRTEFLEVYMQSLEQAMVNILK